MMVFLVQIREVFVVALGCVPTIRNVVETGRDIVRLALNVVLRNAVPQTSEKDLKSIKTYPFLSQNRKPPRYIPLFIVLQRSMHPRCLQSKNPT
jgi:hypothetical protein